MILAQNFKQLNTKFEEIRQKRELNKNELQVLDIVRKYIPLPIIPREKRNPEEVYVQASREIREFTSLKPTDNEKMLLDEWFFVDSPNGAPFDVFYLFGNKQPSEIDEKILISHLLNTLAIAPKDYFIIADFAGFDIESMPKNLSLKKLIQAIPAQVKSGLKQCYVLRSSREFIEYYNDRKAELSIDRMTFVQTKDDISHEIVFSERLSEGSREALLNDGSLQNTIINGHEVVIRVSKYSIHMTGMIGGTPVNDVILLKNIKSVSELTAPDETLAFTVFMKDEKKYVFTTFPASGLYYLVVSAFERATREEIKYPQICTDSSDVDSSKWLLLLISFIGLSDQECVYLQETSYKLLQSVVQMYQFPIDVPNSVEAASDKCYEMMKAAAEYKPEDAGHFIVEVEKIISLVKEPLPAFKLILPWAKIIANGSGGYPSHRYLIELSSQDKNCMDIIREGVWPALMDSQCIRKSLEIFFPVASAETESMLLKFASVDKKLTSEISISELLVRRQNAPANIFTLFNNSCFDLESYGPQLIHAAVTTRIATTSNEMLADLTIKAIKAIVNGADVSGLKGALLAQEDETAGKALSKVIGKDGKLRSTLIELFKKDLGSKKEFEKITSPEKIIKCLETD